jgi:hypothetical protein
MLQRDMGDGVDAAALALREEAAEDGRRGAAVEAVAVVQDPEVHGRLRI